MSDIAIKVNNLSKKYFIGKSRSGSLRDTMAMQFNSFFSGTSTKEEFWALKDVSFEVKQGEVLGIIGRNGAGKSTLLKILSRITEPTTGRVELNGRVASLLEVGTGFHPELTGRENVFLNGSLLGMTRKEVKSKFDEIVDFSGVEQFIDTPVKKYSSGMYVRLAFAVAAHLESEILLVDEVLAVGDLEFQKKCLGKMENIANNGRTLLYVSHNTDQILKLSSMVVLIDKGRKIQLNKPEDVVSFYQNKNQNYNGKIIDKITYHNDLLKIAKIIVNNSEYTKQHIHHLENHFEITIFFQANYELSFSFGLTLHEANGKQIAIFSPGHESPKTNILSFREGQYELKSKIFLPRLHNGNYSVSMFFYFPGIKGYVSIYDALIFSHSGFPINNHSHFKMGKNGYFLIDGTTNFVKN